MTKTNKYFEGRVVYMSTRGYEEVYYPEHPLARKGGLISVHILVMEKVLGRQLFPGEVVHHKDGCKSNNSETNLMCFASNADHTTYHNVTRNEITDYVLYRKAGVYHCILLSDIGRILLQSKGYQKNIHLCARCGNPVSRAGGLCARCFHESSRKVKRPARNVLKKDLREMSIVAIGRKYGVTDNAIRKWCDEYGLPRKSSEIKKISYMEWKKL